MATKTFLRMDKRDIDALIEDLKLGVVEILFEKKDGTSRLMKATLQSRYVRTRFPEEQVRQAIYDGLNEGDPTPSPVLHVWDCDEGGWRSFRTDKVMSCQLTNG